MHTQCFDLGQTPTKLLTDNHNYKRRNPLDHKILTKIQGKKRGHYIHQILYQNVGHCRQ